MSSTIPFDIRIALRVRYNGRIHECVGAIDANDPATTIQIFGDQHPPGWIAEGFGMITYTFGTKCFEPDTSGANAWICTEILDLDETAKWSSSPE